MDNRLVGNMRHGLVSLFCPRSILCRMVSAKVVQGRSAPANKEEPESKPFTTTGELYGMATSTCTVRTVFCNGFLFSFKTTGNIYSTYSTVKCGMSAVSIAIATQPQTPLLEISVSLSAWS